MKTIYLDNNATTYLDPAVFDEMKPFLTTRYGNPSSMHSFGGEVKHNITRAREHCANIINAASGDEIIFTGSGTESNNTAIMSALKSNPDKKHIITSKVEHPAILEFCKNLEENGYYVSYINVDKDGILNLQELKDAASTDTAIISIMAANNETGVIFPIEEIGKIAKDNNILFHTDAVQAVGKIPIDVQKLNIDMLTFSGHKIHAPKGIGALYVKQGTRFSPYIIGGHQEKGRRAGTENVASIVGMGKACAIAQKNINLYSTQIKELRDTLETKLHNSIDNTIVNGKNTIRTGNTLSISFKFIEGESILLLLNEKGICASSGSACTSGSLEPSHVLRAMDISHMYAHGTIRFSLSKYTTKKEIDAVIKYLPPIIERLREISPFS